MNNAVDLISPSRLDVAAKTLVAHSMLTGRGQEVAWATYTATLEAMNPIGTFGEDNKKFSVADYVQSFTRLYASMSKVGFDSTLGSIPLSLDGTLQNGAHRTAIATVLGLEVATTATREVPQVYDYFFFLKAGHDKTTLRRLAWEYLGLKNDVRAILLSGFHQRDTSAVLAEIRKNVQVVCHETLDLTEIGKRRLMDAAYGHLDWYHSDLREKLIMERFGSTSRADLVLFQSGPETDCTEFKQHLRSKYVARGNLERRIHGSDDYAETTQLARVFLSNAQRTFTNLSPLGAEDQILRRAQEFARPEASCLLAFDGGAVVELFGIRTTQDLDHICANEERLCKKFLGAGDCHTPELESRGVKASEILCDPHKIFTVEGYKFLSPDEVASFKRLRAEGKDLEDARALESLASKNVDAANAFSSESAAARARKWKRRSQLMVLVDTALSILPKPLRRLISAAAAHFR